MWLFRVAAALAAFFWIGLVIRDLEPGAAVPISSIIGAILGVALVAWVTARMEADGPRAAAEDALLLTDFLNRSLR
jgi:hypothetical protein